MAEGTVRRLSGRTDEREFRRSLEYGKCAVDAAYFADVYGVIDDIQDHGDGGGTMPFRLWRPQYGVMKTLMTERRILILKARQLGISWLCCAYALWLCLFHDGKVVLLFSQGELEASELLRRIKALYDRLPDWLRDVCPSPFRDNATEMEWANGSRVLSLPATQKAGRSLTASLAILDEAAHIQWATSLYTAMKPTIDGGGQLIVLSTANGIGNLFHQLWIRATSGTGSFRTVFLPWSARPGRDQAWYDTQVAESPDPALVKQEYPSTPLEAFVASGRLRFEPAWVDAQAAHVRDPLPRTALPPALAAIPSLAVYQFPAHGRSYVIGADVAEGLEHRDYSDASILDTVTWEEVASINGHWEPDEFARHLMALSDAYAAPVAVERNNHGHAVLATMKLARFLRIGLGLDERPGWLTNAQTKPQMIDLLATALRDGLIKIRTRAALDELKIYRIKPDGSTGAPPSHNDDRVMSRAIALMFLRTMRAPAVLRPAANPLSGYRG
jgi:hypothetical protein